MRFADIPGHEDVKERLRDMALSGRIPHALLLEGRSRSSYTARTGLPAEIVAAGVRHACSTARSTT